MVSGAVLLVLYVVSGLLFGTGFTLRRSIVYVAGLLVVGLVLGVEKTIERFWPDGGNRHRARIGRWSSTPPTPTRSEEHTSELPSPCNRVCRLLLHNNK